MGGWGLSIKDIRWGQGGRMRKRLMGGSTKPPWYSLHFCLEPVLFIPFQGQMAKRFATSKGSCARCPLSFIVHNKSLKKKKPRGTWVAQSVEHPTLAQVMISRFVSSRPALGSLLSASSLLQIFCSLLAAPPSLVFSPKWTLKKKNNNQVLHYNQVLSFFLYFTKLFMKWPS